MIPVAVVVGLACIAVYLVVSPLRGRTVSKEDNMGNDLRAERDRTLTALIELEEDRMVDKLSDDDFRALRARYEAEALEALRKLTDSQSVALPAEDSGLKDVDMSDIDDEQLEAEIAAARAGMECPQCGALKTHDGACTQCGTD